MKPLRIPWKTIGIVIVVTGICVVGVYCVTPGFFRLRTMKQSESELQQTFNEHEDKKVDLQRYLDRLKTDPITAEKVARDEMGMSKDNEIIFKFDR